jgi:hypothetical protein
MTSPKCLVGVNMHLLRRCVFLLLLVLVGPTQGAAAEPRAVRIGVLAFLDAQVISSQWEPVLEHLATALPGYRPVLVQLDHAALRSAVAVHSVDFVITNPGSYVALEMEFGISRIATLDTAQAPSPMRAVGSAVIVLAERQDLRSLADLAGKRVIAVGEEALLSVGVAGVCAAGHRPVEGFRGTRICRSADGPIDRGCGDGPCRCGHRPGLPDRRPGAASASAISGAVAAS